MHVAHVPPPKASVARPFGSAAARTPQTRELRTSLDLQTTVLAVSRHTALPQRDDGTTRGQLIVVYCLRCLQKIVVRSGYLSTCLRSIAISSKYWHDSRDAPLAIPSQSEASDDFVTRASSESLDGFPGSLLSASRCSTSFRPPPRHCSPIASSPPVVHQTS